MWEISGSCLGVEASRFTPIYTLGIVVRGVSILHYATTVRLYIVEYLVLICNTESIWLINSWHKQSFCYYSHRSSG